MDPNTNLAEQLRIALAIQQINDAADADQVLTNAQQALLVAHAERLADLVLALNTWIAGGGFLPRAWQAGR